jgi:NAD(P)H-dependent flavin oxidoreductase YrpB (nitropropane dioxygenase family)
VPKPTSERYLAAEIDDVIVTRQIDGLPQRVVRNELVAQLESSSAPALLVRALRSGLAYRRSSGASVGDLLRAATAPAERLTRSQTIWRRTRRCWRSGGCRRAIRWGATSRAGRWPG